MRYLRQHCSGDLQLRTMRNRWNLTKKISGEKTHYLKTGSKYADIKSCKL